MTKLIDCSKWDLQNKWKPSQIECPWADKAYSFQPPSLPKWKTSLFQAWKITEWFKSTKTLNFQKIWSCNSSLSGRMRRRLLYFISWMSMSRPNNKPLFSLQPGTTLSTCMSLSRKLALRVSLFMVQWINALVKNAWLLSEGSLSGIWLSQTLQLVVLISHCWITLSTTTSQLKWSCSFIDQEGRPGLDKQELRTR